MLLPVVKSVTRVEGRDLLMGRDPILRRIVAVCSEAAVVSLLETARSTASPRAHGIKSRRVNRSRLPLILTGGHWRDCRVRN